MGTKSQAAVVTLFILVSVALSLAACPTGSVVVKGRVENPPAKALVRVELIYSHRQVEDSADTTLENPRFTIKVPFYTQSRGPVVNGLLEKCSRKPTTVIVRLLQGDEEHDSKTLDLVRDFDSPFPNAYTLRSPLVLNGNDHSQISSINCSPMAGRHRVVKMTCTSQLTNMLGTQREAAQTSGGPKRSQWIGHTKGPG